MAFDASINKIGDNDAAPNKSTEVVNDLGGRLLSSPARNDLSNAIPVPSSVDEMVQLARYHPAHQGGRMFWWEHHNRQPAKRNLSPVKPNDPPPSIQAMLGQSVNLWRMAGADPNAPDFSVERTDESAFKRQYVKESVRL